MSHRDKKPFELTAVHVISGFVAFFAILIGVQVAFISVAVSTHTGLVSKQPYRKGLNYGERIAQAQQQEKLGWRDTIHLSQSDRTLTIEIRDQYGKPVMGLNLGAKIGRAVTDAHDLTIPMQASREGTYVAALPSAMSGTYIADFEASNPAPSNNIVWRARKRLWLQP